MKLVHDIPQGPTAIGPYSPAAIHAGVVYVSGQLPQQPDGTPATGDVADQTRVTLRNLRRVLEESGSSLGDVLQTTVYLVDLDDFPAMNEVYAEQFGTHKPARATVQVAGLVRGARVEISAIAVVPALDRGA